MNIINEDSNKHAVYYKFKVGHNPGSHDHIINNTYNTWQQDRGQDEITEDSLQGKYAEELFKQYIEKYILPKFTNAEYIEYDSFREDGGKKHAPFDSLLVINNEFKEEAIHKVNVEVELSQNGQISSSLKNWLRNSNIFTVEIKSSKIPYSMYKKADVRKIDKTNVNYLKYIAAIIYNNFDYFCYPFYARSEYTRNYVINSFQEYHNYVKAEYGIQDVIANEKSNSLDIYTRIFLDFDDSNTNEYRAIIFGTTLGQDIISNREISKMPGDKSNNARYFFSPIKTGIKYNDYEELKRRLENINE